MITIRIPAPSSLLVANLMGLLGLLVIVGAVAILAGLAWALLTAGLLLVGLSLIATSHAAQAEADKRGLTEVPRAA